MLARLRSWLRSVPARLDGTRLDDGEQLTHLGVGASFPPSDGGDPMRIVKALAENKIVIVAGSLDTDPLNANACSVKLPVTVGVKSSAVPTTVSTPPSTRRNRPARMLMRGGRTLRRRSRSSCCSSGG